MRRVRFEKHTGCVFSCAGPAIEAWDPAMRADAAESPVDGRKGLFAYAPSEAATGFEIGSSATLPSPEDNDGGAASRKSLYGANPNKTRDGAPVNVVALDVKYIKVALSSRRSPNPLWNPKACDSCCEKYAPGAG